MVSLASLQCWLKTHLSTLFHAPCRLCDRRSTQPLCPSCVEAIATYKFSRVPIQILNLPPLYAWGRYEGLLKRSLTLLKYNNCPDLANLLGEWLAEAWLDYDQSLHSRTVLVPIPLHRTKLAQRGFNQAELIARRVSQITGVPILAHGLGRQADTQAQYGLSRTQRDRNLQGAFCLGPQLIKRAQTTQVVLVDDIFTTGATMQAAMTTLATSGIPVVRLLAVAYTPINSEKPPVQCRKGGSIRDRPQPLVEDVSRMQRPPHHQRDRT